MLDVSKETHVGFLREATKFLQEKVLFLEKELAQAKAVQKLDRELCNKLSEELLALRKKFFDAKNERSKNKPTKTNKIRRPNSELLPHNKRPIDDVPSPFSELKEETVLHRLPDATTEANDGWQCDCGSPYFIEMTNTFEECNEIDVVERQYTLRRHRRQKYKCQNCSKIVTAPGGEKLTPGGEFSIHMAAQVADDKFHRHLPLNRQSEMMKERGLNVSTKTLFGLTEHLMNRLSGIPERILEEIKSQQCVHIDESPMKLMRPETLGYVWSVSNACGVYYQYETTRSGKVARELLSGYQGIVMTDAYRGYEFLESASGIEWVLCWSHARRKYVDAVEKYPQTQTVIDLIDEMYKIEHKAENFDHLQVLREGETAVLVDKIRNWNADQQGKYLDSSLIGKAINYFENHEACLSRFLLNPFIPIDNNTGERHQRQPVMGRKNFFGFRSINGADVGMFFYSLIGTCKLLTISPKTYLLEMGLRSARGEAILTPREYGQEIHQRLSLGESVQEIYRHLFH